VYFNEHEPPHFHAEYGGTRAAVSFDGARCAALPPRALRLVRDWSRMRQAELAKNWALARNGLGLVTIAPLEWLRIDGTVARGRDPVRGLREGLRPHSVLLVFDDGVTKQVNLRRLLNGSIFQPLIDPLEFARVRVDHEAGTIVWPNDADIAPETLYLLPDERGNAA
jgi:hypothetical protein